MNSARSIFRNIAIFIVFSVPLFSLAAPLYQPGETLNPACLPSNADCTVATSTASYFTATSTTATSTFPNLSLTNLLVGSDYVTDLTGSGLSIVNGALTAADLTFSTTSADYWETLQTRWATTSSAYFLSTKSTSDLAEGSNLYFTNNRFDTRLAATTSLPNLNTLGGLASIGSTTGTTTFLGGAIFNGNVGVGTVSPTAKLQVDETSSRTTFTGVGFGTVAIRNLQGTSNYSTLDFSGGSSPTNVQSRIASIQTVIGSYLSFGTSNNYANGITNTAMTINPSGYVGIGSSTPYARLDVVGANNATFPLFQLSKVSGNATTTVYSVDNNGNASTTGSFQFGTFNQRKVVIEGDSISNGATDWPGYLASSSPYFKAASQTNYAVSGSRTDEMLAEYATEGHVSRPTLPGDDYWFFIYGGINDSALTAQESYDNLKSIWSQARSDGYTVVAFTIFKSRLVTGANETRRASLNEKIKSDPTLYDYLIDMDLVLDPYKNFFYFSDDTHPNVAGGELMANWVTKTINMGKSSNFSNSTGTTTQPYAFNQRLLGNVVIGTSTQPTATLSLFGKNTISNVFQVTTSASTTALNVSDLGLTTIMYASTTALTVSGSAYFPGSGIWNSSGNVGIGTTSPYTKLSVVGDIVATNITATSTFDTSGTTGGYKIDGNLILQASSTNYSTLVGRGAGATLLADGLANTALGFEALKFATSSDNNTAVGHRALYLNTTGSNNTANGSYSLNSNTTGTSNTANGSYSLYANTTGSYNTALGYQALTTATSSDSNTAVGFRSLYLNTTGASNTASGYGSLYSNTTGNNNVASGYASLFSNTTGGQNTAYGATALYSNTTGSNNTANGYFSLNYNTTGSQNSAYGRGALQANTTGNNNTATGYNSLYSNITGAQNTASGMYSLYYATSSTYSTAIGYLAGVGSALTANDYNSAVDTYMTFLGTSASRDSNVASTTALTNSTAIGYNAKVGGSNMLVLGNNVNVGIGTTSPYAKLSVVGETVSEYFTATSTTATSTFAGAVGIGTTSPAYANLSNSGLTLGLNKNIVLTTDRTTNNFKGNIIFKNEGASTTKSGLEWFGFGTTTSSAWIVWHQSLNGELDGSHGAPHLEIETADLAGQKQGRWTVQSECDYDCIQTFNQSEIYITRNSGQTNGNLLFNGGGQLRNTGGMQVIPNNAINTKGFRIATSTDNDIAIDVTSGTELEILDNVAVTGTGSFTSYVSIGTTTVDSAISQLTIGKSGASGTTLGATLDLRQTQTAINDTSNSVLGKILFTGNDKFTGEDGIGAEIRGTATGIWNGTTNDYPTSLSFLTTPNGAGALAEIMRITDTGNVGIGTTSPYAKLSVVGEAVAENFTSTSTAINTFPNLSATNATSTNLFSTTASTTDQYVGGLMGMGTSTPAARLEISHRETTPAISIDAGASGNDVFRIFRGTAGGSSGLGMALTVSNANPQFSFRANMSSMSSGVARNSILYDATNASLTISTSTVATGTTGVEPFVIKNSTGNIGLGGTSTPWAVVSVTGRFQSAGTPTFVVASSSKVDLIVMQSGNVGVATTSPWTKFGVTGTVAMSGLTTSAGTPNALCINASTKEVTENAASSCLVSDEDQKTPLKPLNIDALSMIRDMQPSSFSYKDNLKRLRYGFGAQSLQKIDNQLGDAFDKDGVARSIDIPAILAVNTAAIQELDEKIGGGMATAKKTAQDNWQWALIGLLALGMGYQQYQISKLKK